MKLKLTFATAALAAFGLVGAAPVMAADCGKTGTVTIAEMTWLSSATLAHIAKRMDQIVAAVKEGYSNIYMPGADELFDRPIMVAEA